MALVQELALFSGRDGDLAAAAALAPRGLQHEPVGAVGSIPWWSLSLAMTDGRPVFSAHQRRSATRAQAQPGEAELERELLPLAHEVGGAAAARREARPRRLRRPSRALPRANKIRRAMGERLEFAAQHVGQLQTLALKPQLLRLRPAPARPLPGAALIGARAASADPGGAQVFIPGLVSVVAASAAGVRRARSAKRLWLARVNGPLIESPRLSCRRAPWRHWLWSSTRTRPRQRPESCREPGAHQKNGRIASRVDVPRRKLEAAPKPDQLMGLVRVMNARRQKIRACDEHQ